MKYKNLQKALIKGEDWVYSNFNSRLFNFLMVYDPAFLS